MQIGILGIVRESVGLAGKIIPKYLVLNQSGRLKYNQFSIHNVFWNPLQALDVFRKFRTPSPFRSLNTSILSRICMRNWIKK